MDAVDCTDATRIARHRTDPHSGSPTADSCDDATDPNPQVHDNAQAMTAPDTLNLEPHRTTLSSATGAEVVIDVGIDTLTGRFFRDDAPTPLDIERAIDAVEEALQATGLRHAHRGELVTNAPSLAALPGLRAQGEILARDEVEVLFQRLSSASMRHAGAGVHPLYTRQTAAALLILRECMHHLAYDALRRSTS